MRTFAAIVLAIVTMPFCGCQSPSASGDNGVRFHEADQVSAVLQFSSWDYTFLVQPAYRENGYLQQVRRDNIRQVFDKVGAPRDLAVVVIGWTYESENLKRLVTDWKAILAECGFRRVVFLRPDSHKQLNGSLIIDDAALYPPPGGSAS